MQGLIHIIPWHADAMVYCKSTSQKHLRQNHSPWDKMTKEISITILFLIYVVTCSHCSLNSVDLMLSQLGYADIEGKACMFESTTYCQNQSTLTSVANFNWNSMRFRTLRQNVTLHFLVFLATELLSVYLSRILKKKLRYQACERKNTTEIQVNEISAVCNDNG